MLYTFLVFQKGTIGLPYKNSSCVELIVKPAAIVFEFVDWFDWCQGEDGKTTVRSSRLIRDQEGSSNENIKYQVRDSWLKN